MSAIPPRPLLEAVALSKRFVVGSRWPGARRHLVQAVDGVSFRVHAGESLGLVGESGCGKSTLARCLVRLHDIDDGALRFEDRDITRLTTAQLRPLRARLQMVFQDPSGALNPRRRVGDLLAEPLRVHRAGNPAAIRERVHELLSLVGLRKEHLLRFPHEFSGGQRQRIGIARALVLSPSLIVADEPVSALDVSIQAQIVNLLADLQARLGLTYIFIAHDLGVVRHVSTRVAVMYLGALVELGPTDALFARPRHPYTQALISAVPQIETDPARRRVHLLLPGEPPSPIDPPAGCRFHPRCIHAQGRCRTERPQLQDLGGGQQAACHFPLDGGPRS